jgi:hypothetical protein
MVAGVAKLHDGACDAVCGGIAGVSCADGQICDLPAGQCESADLQGHCRPRPDFCAEYIDLVCGCDGITYFNDCARLASGAQLAHFGPCLSQCDPATDTCPDGEACLPRPGSCDASAAVCTPVSETCPLVAAPFPLLAVCGCDGVTYDSLCAAARAGVGVAHEGTCDVAERCVTDQDCAPGLACIPIPGLCWLVATPIAPAECVEIPQACPTVVDPVCGCDGKTYGSECEALRAHAGVAHAGPCSTGSEQ